VKAEAPIPLSFLKWKDKEINHTIRLIIMADPLSISAAAVGFVSLVLQVAQTTTQFVENAKGFPEEFKKLCLTINEFGVLVRRLTPVIEKVEVRYETQGIGDFASLLLFAQS